MCVIKVCIYLDIHFLLYVCIHIYIYLDIHFLLYVCIHIYIYTHKQTSPCSAKEHGSGYGLSLGTAGSLIGFRAGCVENHICSLNLVFDMVVSLVAEWIHFTLFGII